MATLSATALKVIEAYSSWDIKQIMDVRAPECIQEMCPSTSSTIALPHHHITQSPPLTAFSPPPHTGTLGIAPMDNTAFEAWQKSIMHAFRNVEIKILEMIEDPESNKVAMWAKSSAETDIGPYTNEYMIVLHMNKEKTKIVRLREFADSAYANEFFPRLKKHFAEKQGAKN